MYKAVPRAAGNMALQRQLRSGAIQAKLAVSTPGDVYEQEADRVAEQVSATGSVPPVQRKCGCGGAAASGGECEECRAAGTPAIQRSAAGAGGQGADTSQAVRGVPSTGGSPLDSSSRAFMESRFGQDFGGVRER
ncbi:MAG TPA: hypothetical protein VHU19_11200 [Pyrinomonadaceae bacterium]|nr:hypothetical protein [Pyrinomonadaceae bacterium]